MLISILAIIGMIAAFLSGRSIGFRSGLNAKTFFDHLALPKVGDLIGFMWAECYMEGEVKVVLDNYENSVMKDLEDIKYIVEIIRDEDDTDRHFSYVGRTKTIDMKYRRWTMLKKHENHDELPSLETQS